MRFFLRSLLLLVLAWVLALAWFVLSMPREGLPGDTKTDAIIVLTGGSVRVERGLELLAEGAAPVLFISGVGEHATEAELIDVHASDAVREKIYESGGEIVLDHASRSTLRNANESATFIASRQLKSVRLVTADYHMKRALYELRVANPGVDILPDPVFPEGFKRSHWWRDDTTRHLLFSEFYKYWAVRLRDAVRPSS